MAKKKRTRRQSSGISLKSIEQAITRVETRIRALRVTGKEAQREKDVVLKFLAALKELLKYICRFTGGRFIPFFLALPPDYREHLRGRGR